MTRTLVLDAADPVRPLTDRYRVTLAADAADVTAAQRLRYDVFTHDFGALLPVSGESGDLIDVDPFDDLCDHLVVRHTAALTPGRIVATYRMLPSHANDAWPRAAGLYSAQEFELSELEPILDRTVEAGRSSVHPDHRNGTAISLLWGGIARYLQLTGNRYLIGCVSIPLTDGGGTAAAFADLARAAHSSQEWTVTPHRPFVTSHLDRPERPQLPALVKGYLRLGAKVCGPPALDEEFGAADFLMVLDLEAADPRYRRRFLGQAD